MVGRFAFDFSDLDELFETTSESYLYKYCQPREIRELVSIFMCSSSFKIFESSLQRNCSQSKVRLQCWRPFCSEKDKG